MVDSDEDELGRLRAEIDRIDDAVVDLLLERVAVVRRIAEVKASAPGIALRPAREAAILRRLAARAAPAIPAAAITRMWRELLAATTRLQTPYSVAVLADPATPGVLGLARDHFGSSTPLLPVETAQHGFRMVAAGEAALLVLPAPVDGGFGWRKVAATLIDSPLSIVGRLPFCPAETDDMAAGALVIGALAEEPAEASLTMLAVETDPLLSRARLRDLVEVGGIELVTLVSLMDHQPESAFHLLEVKGTDEAALSGLRHAFGPLRDRLLRLDVLGSYPQPLPKTATH